MKRLRDILSSVDGFEWDTGNREKNKMRHDVTAQECVEIFQNEPLVLFPDTRHSTVYETRFGAYGITRSKRRLSVYFTIRNDKIRIISARDMSRKERKQFDQIIYEEQ